MLKQPIDARKMGRAAVRDAIDSKGSVRNAVDLFGVEAIRGQPVG